MDNKRLIEILRKEKGDRSWIYKEAAVQLERLMEAIEYGGFDLSPCSKCFRPIVTIPDGISICKNCVEKN